MSEARYQRSATMFPFSGMPQAKAAHLGFVERNVFGSRQVQCFPEFIGNHRQVDNDSGQETDREAQERAIQKYVFPKIGDDATRKELLSFHFRKPLIQVCQAPKDHARTLPVTHAFAVVRR